ncbi:MAG: methyl-accepting chemotaxis protein [Oscillatoria sp. SIO1A7]|nr:methyl-accepting chemotaxis protein [Oscillatoria sp. SIO1A7]
MKLGQTLYAGFAIPPICLAILGIYSLRGFENIDRQVGTIYDDRLVPLQQIKLISDAYGLTVVDAVNKASEEKWTASDALVSINSALGTASSIWDKYKQTDLSQKERQIIDEIEILLTEANREIELLKGVLEQEDRSGLEEFDGSLYDSIDPLTAKLQELSDLQLQVAKQERQKAAEVYRNTRAIFIPLLLLALLIGSPIGFVVVRRALVATLKDIINTIAAYSTEIAVTTEEQERITQQQASSFEETTVTMDELKASSKQAAMQADAAAIKAKEVLAQCAEGSKELERARLEMAALKQTMAGTQIKIEQLRDIASQIGKIADMVSDFSIQTNMLALNAAVEAVRAGDRGLGFGVVAAEIRKLADQSRQSAENINALVTDIEGAINATIMVTSDSSISVEEGSRIAEKTTAVFGQVQEAIDQVFFNSQEISMATQQQAISIQQVTEAMNHLNGAAKETASAIAQTKVGTGQLHQKAIELQEMV